MRHHPGLSLIAIMALALGIGATTSMFSIVHGGLRPLPFDAITITDGFLNKLQRENGKTSIRQGYTHLEHQKAWTNFENAADRKVGEAYNGPVFEDGEAFKWLEAVAWEEGRMPAADLNEWLERYSALSARAQAEDGYLATFNQVGKIPLSKPSYPGASPLRLNATDDPYDDAAKVTSVFVSVDPIVHKGTLGLGTLNLTTREMNYTPIGAAFPMLGFMVSPDRKLGYSVMFNYSGGSRRTEWWVWDLQTHQVIKTQAFESRPTFKFGISSDGKKLYLYGSGSTLEVFDAATLTSRKLLYLNRDITTNLVTLARK